MYGSQGHGNAGAYHKCHWVRGVLHCGQITELTQIDKHPFTLTPAANLE